MHARVPLARSTAMDRYARILFSLILVGATAACAAVTDEPPAPTVPVATATANATSTAQAMPTASAHDMGAMGSHDMGSMGSGDAAEEVTVDIANFAFAPAELRISAGTEVTFTNSDTAPHTATAGTDEEPMPERFDTGLLQPGDSFSVRFDEPGTFAYFCERHPPMTGVIVRSSANVEAGGQTRMSAILHGGWLLVLVVLLPWVLAAIPTASQKLSWRFVTMYAEVNAPMPTNAW